MIKELIIPIPSWEDFYCVSNRGYVISKERFCVCGKYNQLKRVPERILNLKPNDNGYVYVALIKRPRKQIWTMGRLVATHFIPNPENKPEVNHIDGNKSNNAAWNLEWVTAKENTAHAIRTGLKKNSMQVLENHKIPIIQFDLNGNRIAEWDSLEAAKHIADPSCISRCLSGQIHTAGGYYWQKRLLW